MSEVVLTCDVQCDELAADWICVDSTAIAAAVRTSDVAYL